MYQLICIFILSCIFNSIYAQNKQERLLEFDLTSVKEQPVNIVIERRDLGDYKTTYDTCKIFGDKFIHTSPLLEPEVLKLIFYWPNNRRTASDFFQAISLIYRVILQEDLKPIISVVEKTRLNIEFDNLSHELLRYKNRTDSIVKLINYKGQTITDIERRIATIKDSMDLEIDNIYKKSFLNHLSSPLGLYALCRYADMPLNNQRRKSQPDMIEEMFNQLSPNIRQLPSAKILSAKLSLAKELLIGQDSKDISLPDTIGKMVSLKDYLGQYVLLEFWASWCAPCRAESPYIIKAYNEYAKKGFQVISITQDKMAYRKQWLKAIKKDGVGLWPQLIDEESLAHNTYDIRLIPANFLIDRNGVIIGKDLRGAALDDALRKAFK
jgi:peroxiredoxin